MSDDPTSRSSGSESRRGEGGVPWKLVGLGFGVVAAFALGLVFRAELKGALESVEGFVRDAGWAGPVIYVGIYVAWTVACLPGSLVTILGGSIFAHSPVLAVASVSVGSTLGAAACFLIARHVARDQVRERIGDSGFLGRLDRATERYGWVFVAITRLVPAFPFNLLNYGFGLTRIGFWTYVLVSWICMLPATVVYVLGAGALTRALKEGQVPWGLLAGLAVALVVMVGVGVFAKRRWASIDHDERLEIPTPEQP